MREEGKGRTHHARLGINQDLCADIAQTVGEALSEDVRLGEEGVVVRKGEGG
jgi:hypothetical protein